MRRGGCGLPGSGGTGGPARDGPEVALHQRPRPGGVEVAAEGEHGVVGGVVGAEEVAHVVQGGGVQVVHAPDDGVGVRMVGGEDHLLQPLVPVAVGGVVDALEPLVLHHRALPVQLLLRDGGEEGAHPVGLQPERQLQPVRRHGLEVVGAVQPGGAVHHAAHPLDVRDVLGPGDVLGPLEHQVLEEVGEPGAPGALVPAPHSVPEVHRHHGIGVVLGKDHPQPVGEGVLVDRDSHVVEGGSGE